MERPPAPNPWMSIRERLDEALVRRGFYPSRARARDAVLRGTVRVDGELALKPAKPVGERAEIAVDDGAQHYVSRAALKLLHGLDHFAIEVRGRYALDVGASTGGFTQVLLERGAAHVMAIDVGHGQMQLSDPRLTLIEGLNARDITAQHVAHPVQVIVCDVSFISLRLVLPPVMALAGPGADLVALIKPQFEVGRALLGKGGLVDDAGRQESVCDELTDMVRDLGWRVFGVTPSPVAGGDGNREFLIAARLAED